VKNCANGSRIYDRTKSLSEINSKAPIESARDPASFIAVKSAIILELIAENPFAGDDICARRPRDKGPRRVSLECIKFILHDGNPIRITESHTDI
jgi:hypothetical protein